MRFGIILGNTKTGRERRGVGDFVREEGEIKIEESKT